MSEFRSHAVVLRTQDYREADKLVTMLTRDEGKITAIARGVRKIKGKSKALVEPLTLGFFLLHRGKSLDTLIQGEIVKPHRKLQSDLVLFSYALYFCELCEASLPEREPAPEIFDLLLTALQQLEHDSSAMRVARCFELNLLEVLGYRPLLEHCLHCGSESAPFRFDPERGGIVCAGCPVAAGSIPVSGAAVAVMKRFLENGFYRLTVCAVPDVLSEEIKRVTSALLLNATGKARFKTMGVLQSFEEMK
ncbi:MAG: DNA repair protein RecO [Dethiobacter sp.]|jgi:DNA repair protein RecO (recombination protein O)|nr:DNA repair protein RecO [Dethiobacter sp.]